MANGGGSRRFDWVIAAIAVLAIVGTAVGHRVAVALEDVSFVALLLVEILFLAIAWWRLMRGWRGEAARWRIWVGLLGCVAFSLTFLIPMIPILSFSMRLQPRYLGWVDFKAVWLGCCMAGLISGIFAARGVRFPLVFGGLIMAMFVAMIPVAVL